MSAAAARPCLGRIPSRHDSRTLQLTHYIDDARLPAPPMARDWMRPAAPVSWGVFGNDALGDCTCAALAHLFQAHGAQSDRPVTIHTADVVGMYERVGGYDPTRPETDRGAQMIDALCALREVGLGGHRASAFVQFDPGNQLLVETAVNLFGGVYVGLDLPLAAEDQAIWNVAREDDDPARFVPGSWGGHAVAMLGYSRTLCAFVTWGAVKFASIPWFRAYATEAWCLIDPLWVDEGLAPSGFDLAALRADLVDLHRGVPPLAFSKRPTKELP